MLTTSLKFDKVGEMLNSMIAEEELVNNYVKSRSCRIRTSPRSHLPSRATMPLKPKTYQFLVGLFASLGSFTYGYDLGIVASVIATPDFVKRFDAQNHATAL